MISGRDIYAKKYTEDLDYQAYWLTCGAAHKAKSVLELAGRHGIRPKKVLELGAGTGAILKELMASGFAEHYTAVDYSEEACNYLASTLPEVTVHRLDITQERVPGEFDLVIVSHVLEHIEQDKEFLRSLEQNLAFRYLVIECPLEDLPIETLRGLVRDRRQNLAGHVQWYTAQSFQARVGGTFRILDSRWYTPWLEPSVINRVCDHDAYGFLGRIRRHITMGLGPHYAAPIWKRYWVGYMALLCEKQNQPSGQP